MRCVGSDGSMLGIITTREAQLKALNEGLDLVEISPAADPPVCRIMDFGKFRYEESRKEREARKHQHVHITKEIKFHPNVEEHDYQTKINHIKKFLEKGHKVKITLVFRGREMAHQELGHGVVSRVLKDCSVVSVVEMGPKMIGRIILAILGPRPKK